MSSKILVTGSSRGIGAAIAHALAAADHRVVVHAGRDAGDYTMKPAPSFPLIDTTKERTDMWYLKRYGLPAMYWNPDAQGTSLNTQRRTAALLVTAQFTLIAAQWFPRRRRRHHWPTPTAVRDTGIALQCSGAVLAAAAAAGLGAGLTASPLPHPAAQLRRTGIFRRVRHPIYTGLLIASTGRTVASGDLVQVAITGALLGLLQTKATFEEAALRTTFPEYDSYAASTPRFLPRPRRHHRCAEQ